MALGKPEFSIKGSGPIIGFLKKNTTLPCNVDSDFATEITWRRTSLQLPQRRSEVINSSLIIYNIEDDDEGFYTCFAKNIHGLISYETYLKVKSVGGKLYYIVTVN